MERRTLALYREWNESKRLEQAASAGLKTVEERWREYKDLMSLCWTLKPENSIWEDRRTMEEWGAYL